MKKIQGILSQSIKLTKNICKN